MQFVREKSDVNDKENKIAGIIAQETGSFHALSLLYTATHTTGTSAMFKKSASTALPDPSFQVFPGIRELALDQTDGSERMRLASLNEMADLLLGPEMRICEHGVFLLVFPYQVADVPCGDGQYDIGGSNANCDRNGGAEQDVAVARDDGAGH